MCSDEIKTLFDEYRVFNDAFYQKIVQISKELASKYPNNILPIKAIDLRIGALICVNKFTGQIYYCWAFKVVNDRLFGYINPWAPQKVENGEFQDDNWIDLFVNCDFEIEALEQILSTIANGIEN